MSAAFVHVATGTTIRPTRLMDLDELTRAAGDLTFPVFAKAVATAKIEDYFNKLVKNEAQFVEVPYPIARALQGKYSFSISEAGLDKVVEQARTFRGSADSARSQQPPTGGDTAMMAPPDTPPLVTPPLVTPPPGN